MNANPTSTSATLDTLADLLRELVATSTCPPAELLTRDDMAAALNVGVSTFDRLKAAGKIGPRPAELAGLKWHRPEVLAWLARRDHTGELHTADTWPAVWRTLQDRKPAR